MALRRSSGAPAGVAWNGGATGVSPPPLVVLDVDGVLNPYAMGDVAGRGAFDDFERCEARGFLLRLSRAMGRALVALPAELCWATTWADSVDRDVAPRCDLPPGLRVAARPPVEPAALLANWKLVQVRRLVETLRRPFVWVDDDAFGWPGPDGEDAHAWAARCDLPNLLLAPDPATGLTAGDIEQIAAFLASLRPSPARRATS
jgi:hypothetical protein